ncbi:hypothetical protein FQA47_014439 [Oryzias melastigma]|uniref:Uncharacterized protein n=1 Tax=Oryzias melastigma TaxID=30732 RepID=A0A834CFN4_ORYME|nr:hypothetical protein FQA47_014439 [Oryzias melastigma]
MAQKSPRFYWIFFSNRNGDPHGAGGVVAQSEKLKERMLVQLQGHCRLAGRRAPVKSMAREEKSLFTVRFGRVHTSSPLAEWFSLSFSFTNPSSSPPRTHRLIFHFCFLKNSTAMLRFIRTYVQFPRQFFKL